jgi:arabinose-5-phosphate isomerase
MSLPAESQFAVSTPLEQLREGRRIVRAEADALSGLAERLDGSFCEAVGLMVACRGSVIVTGMGKAGLIGRKIAATLSSTGTRAHTLHPAEAVHGDIGCLHRDDVVLALSHSGETEEVLRLLPILRRLEVPLIAITADNRSSLGREADIVLPIGRQQEAGVHGLAPSVSTTVMLALGDALGLVASRVKGFTPRQFALFHPGGSLGQQLRTVGETMRPREQLRISHEQSTVREVFRHAGGEFRRTGAVILVDGEGRLSGLFTDSDLARLIARPSPPFDEAIAEVMTRRPKTISLNTLLAEAIDLMSRHKLSELPVIDEAGRPVGLIDITDVLELMPREVED